MPLAPLPAIGKELLNGTVETTAWNTTSRWTPESVAGRLAITCPGGRPGTGCGGLWILQLKGDQDGDDRERGDQPGNRSHRLCLYSGSNHRKDGDDSGRDPSGDTRSHANAISDTNTKPEPNAYPDTDGHDGGRRDVDRRHDRQQYAAD